MTQPTYSPLTGRLATTDDFEHSLGLDLQAMLNACNPNVLHCSDAWAEGNTDTAFAINNFVGVQRSHRSNDWNYGWVDLANNGRGTYVYMPNDPQFIQNLSLPKTDREEISRTPITNNTASPITSGVTYTETESQSTSITKAWEVGLKLKTSFKLFGHGFDLEASFKTSSSEENTKSNTSTTQFTATVSVPANSSYELVVTQETTTQDVQYGLDLTLGSDNSGGSVGKATTKDQGNWDTFFKIEDVLKGKEKQTIKYEVEVTTVVTKIVLNAVKASPDGSEATIISKTATGN